SSSTGPAVDLPFPSQGESAVAIPTFGFEASTPDQHPQPIASLTKLMTADVHTGQSNVKVAYGEVMTERQLLEGLLVHSANNFAVLLAELVAGSESAMVSDMNATAVTLGLRSTTYADVSGFDPATTSDA